MEVLDHRIDRILGSIQKIVMEINEVKTIIRNKKSEVKDFGGDTQVRRNTGLKFDSNKLDLNIGGTVFHTTRKLLLRVPNSRLAKVAIATTEDELVACGATYNQTYHYVSFSRSSKNFQDILEFYHEGSLHISSPFCPVELSEDLKYWGISESQLEPCCYKKLLESQEHLETEDDEEDKNEEPGSKTNKLQWMYDLFEKPHSSMCAGLLGVFSLLCIIISTVILTLDTLPYFQKQENQFVGEFAPFAIIEMCYMSYFTLEFLLRAISCPSKAQFCKNLMNWIDLLAIVPYFITLSLNLTGVEGLGVITATAGDQTGESQGFTETVYKVPFPDGLHRSVQTLRLLKLARIIKALRIFRIFKLARHSTGLRALGNVMAENYKELGLIFLLLFIGAIMFASLAFVFESDQENTHFKTMLDAYWWAIITMTTVSSTMQ